MQKNTTVGLMLGVLFPAVFFVSQSLLPDETDWFPEDDDREFTFEPPPNFNPLKPEVFKSPKIQKGRAGTPVPVSEGDPSITLIPQDSLSSIPGAVNGSDDGWSGTNGGGGSATGLIDVPDEAEPAPFVEVERYPVIVHQVKPEYPQILLKAGIQGTVVVSIWVNKEGRVHKVRLLVADNDLFNEAAIEAAKQFLFTPAYMNNGPVSVWVNMPFSFRLK